MTVDQHSRPLFGGAITAEITKDWLDARYVELVLYLSVLYKH